MQKEDWFSKAVDRAREQVNSWPEWKRAQANGSSSTSATTTSPKNDSGPKEPKRD